MLPRCLDTSLGSRKPPTIPKVTHWIGVLGVLAALLMAALAPATAGAAECTNTWTGPAEGTWQTGANWSAGHAPTSTEVACIGSGKTVNVTAGTNQAAVVQGEGTLTVKESTLEVLSISEPSAIKNLTVKYNAILTGPATISVSSTFAWTHESTMSGTGTTVVGSGASGSITTGGGWARLKERRLVSEGSFAVNEGILAMTEGAVFENKGTLTVNHEAGVWDILDNGGTIRPTLVNSGILQKTAGTGETKFDVNFENPGGEINAQTGTFGFTLKGGTGVLGSGSTLKGPIRLKGPAFTTESLDGKEAKLTMREASLSVSASHTATIGTLVMDYKAEPTGVGTLEITKALAWESESKMSGSGSTVIGASATATVNMYYGQLATRTLVNEGTFTLEGQGAITASEGATFKNEATLNANAVEAYARFPGILTAAGSKSPPILINNGTIQKTVGTGNTRLNINVENNGTITAKTGTLLYNAAGSTVTLAPESVLEGNNRFEKSGIAANNFKMPSGTLTARESPITFAGKSTSIANFKIEYGTTISGSGDFEVTQSFDWHGQSTLGGSGTTTLGASTSNILDSGATVATLSQRSLVNNGAFTQTSSSKLMLANGATFRNKGTYNLNSEPYPTWVRDSIRYEKSVASNKFVNTGLFQRTEGKINLEVTPEFENHGVLKPQSSGIEIKNPVTVAQTEEFGKRSKCGDPVDCATGDFSESQTDLFVGGRGVVLEMTRAYSAQAAAAASSSGAFGYGWSGSFSERLTIEGSGEKATLVQADGNTIPFTKVSGTTYAGPAWSQNTLSGSPEAGYTLLTADQTGLSFSGTGRLEGAEDRNGNETTLSYDEAGRLKAVTDAAGRQLKLAYNGGGQIESVEDPMGHLVKYAYEGGHLTSVTLPGQETPRWKFKYDASHRITEMTDGRGGKTTNEYDASHRVKSQTDPGGHTLTFEYAPFHTKVTNKATGAVTDQWFTSNNQPYSITHGYATASATTQDFTYNEAGQLTSETDGNGHTTTYGYDANGNRTSEKDAPGNEAKWTYNGAHDLTSATTPRGETTTITRDEAGNPETISRPGPSETTQTFTLDYDENGQLESVTDPLERTWSYEYSSQGDLTAETDPLGNTHSYEYDEDSRLVAAISPRGNAEGAEPAEYETTVERDALGRLVEVTNPLGHSTEYAYDGNGNLTTETDANGNATKFTYNANNEQTKIEKPNGAVLETAYDGAGNVTSQTDANEQTTTYVRNVLGQPVEVVDPLSRKTIQEFDAAGNLKAVTDPAERKTSFVYDAADRLTEVSYSEEATPDVEFGYNADSDLTAMADGTGESAFTYDVLGRLTEAENGKGAVVGYEYDLAEQLTKLTYPNEKSVSQAFDDAGRLESVTDWLGGTTSFVYDADSNLESITFPAATGNVDEFAYDPAGFVEKVTYLRGAETLASISYVRNKVGQVKEESTQGLPGTKEISYGYDKANRLISAGEASFEYDLADNLTEGLGSTNAYDKASQLETGTGVSYTYDKLGERTKRTPESGQATTYGYSQAGELTSVARPEEGEMPAIDQGFAYDGVGLMASVTSGETTKNLTWDVGAALPLLLGDGQNSYIYGPSGLPVMQIPPGEEVPTYLHHDQLGSTRLLTDGTGKATGTFSYEPYGALAGATGSASTPLGFAGEYTDSASGLQYLRARFYDPATGQFLTRDPLEALTRQPYAYAANDPVNLVDRDGKVAAAACVGSAVIPVPVPNPCSAAKVGIGIAGGALAGAAAGLADDVFGGEEEIAGNLTISKGLAGRLARSKDNEEVGCKPSDMPNFGDPSQAPGQDWGWKGNGPPGSKEGSWYNPKTGESLHPDLGHPGSIGPHYDYRAPNGSDHRVYPDGRVVPK
jgi:RHS repeat-associated protein